MSMFSKNLQKVCSQKAVKQVDLAYRLGVPATTVSGWVCGRHEPPIDMLLKVCAFLEVPVGWMVGDPRDPKAGVDPQLLEETEARLKAMEDKALELGTRLADVTAERDKYKEIAYRAEREVEAVKKYGDRYRNMVDTLKADGASKITIEF